jgi:hypothetical protein
MIYSLSPFKLGKAILQSCEANSSQRPISHTMLSVWGIILLYEWNSNKYQSGAV